MSVNSKIIQALSNLKYPIVPDIYIGKEMTYITFNYAADVSAEYGDNEPAYTTAHMQIHFFAPLVKEGVMVSYLREKKEIRESLFKAGFTYPEVTVLTEKENNIMHIIYECAIAEEREE